MKQDSKPLWQRLNEERTQGDWSVTTGKHSETTDMWYKGETWFNVNGEDGVIADFLHGRCLDADEEEANTNAQYTALAVNNLASLAEALETTLNAMLNLVRQLPVDETLGDYNLDFCESAEQIAKEALNKIS